VPRVVIVVGGSLVVAAHDDPGDAPGAMEIERLVEPIAQHVGGCAVVTEARAEHQRAVERACDVPVFAAHDHRHVHGDDERTHRREGGEDQAGATEHARHTPRRADRFLELRASWRLPR